MLKKNFNKLPKLIQRRFCLIILMSASLIYLLFATDNFASTCLAAEKLDLQKATKLQATQKVHNFTLDNGLEVHIIQDETFPIIAHTLLYKVGSAEDPKGKSGLAHYLEHLMFRSTTSTEDISKKLGNTFSNYNAMTDSYFTLYHSLINADKLEQIMQIEADRMVNLQITENAADLERKIVLEERQLRIGNSPANLLEEEMMAAFYRNDKSWQTIGWEHEILALTSKDALAFYQKFYSPSNAVLILVGDINLKKTKDMINKYYAGLTNNNINNINNTNNININNYININDFNKTRQPSETGKLSSNAISLANSKTKNFADNRESILAEPLHLSDIKIYMQNSINKKANISYIFPAPNVKDERLAAALVASYILGGTKFSKLYNELVYNLRVATDVVLDYRYWTQSLGILWFSVIPASESLSLEVLEQHIEKIIEEVSENGVTAEELVAAQAKAQFELAPYLEGVESLDPYGMQFA